MSSAMPSVVSSRSPRRHWHRRRQARPSEIAVAALTAFSQNGYAATTMAEIAEAADITKGTIYLYFTNKEELFNALVRMHIADKLEAKIAALGEDEVDVLTAIRNYLDVITDMVLTEEAFALGRIITAEARNFPALQQFWQTQVLDRLLERITALMQQGIQQGVIAGIEPEAAARLCLAPALQVQVWRSNHEPDADVNPRAVLSHQREIILRGLQNGAGAG